MLQIHDVMDKVLPLQVSHNRKSDGVLRRGIGLHPGPRNGLPGLMRDLGLVDKVHRGTPGPTKESTGQRESLCWVYLLLLDVLQSENGVDGLGVHRSTLGRGFVLV